VGFGDANMMKEWCKMRMESKVKVQVVVEYDNVEWNAIADAMDHCTLQRSTFYLKKDALVL
jgi:ACT domain-containing protein